MAIDWNEVNRGSYNKVDTLISKAISDGGVTLVRGSGREYTGRGYIVGGGYPGITVDTSTGDHYRAVEWIERLPGDVLFIGSWKDGETIYLDAVDILKDKRVALRTAKRRGELAIYDLSKGEEIRVK